MGHVLRKLQKFHTSSSKQRFNFWYLACGCPIGSLQSWLPGSHLDTAEPTALVAATAGSWNPPPSPGFCCMPLLQGVRQDGTACSAMGATNLECLCGCVPQGNLQEDEDEAGCHTCSTAGRGVLTYMCMVCCSGDLWPWLVLLVAPAVAHGAWGMWPLEKTWFNLFTPTSLSFPITGSREGGYDTRFF